MIPRQARISWIGSCSIPKKGFCNYYATAEVILLRSVGIPARMVVGFAQGEFTSPDLYVVRERDAACLAGGLFPGRRLG